MPICVSALWAHAIDQLQITIFIKGAGTMRGVVTAKLLKKLIHFVYLVYLALKLLPVSEPVPVSTRRRLALARLHVPDLDILVIASTCYFRVVWGPCNGPYPPVCDEISQHTKQSGKGRQLDDNRFECPVNVDTHVPVDVSQILTLLSLLPLATCLPSGLKETLKT